MIGIRRSLLGGRTKWLLRDRFIAALTAGNVNHTASEPGPGGKRTVTDTGSNLSISALERLTIAGGTGSAGDPRLSYNDAPIWPVARTPGMVLSCTAVYVAGSDDRWMVGWNTAAYSYCRDIAWYCFSSAMYSAVATARTLAFVPTDGLPYHLWIVLRSTGAHMLHQAPGDLVPVLDVVDDRAANTNLYPMVMGQTGAFTVDDLLIRDRLWLPIPLASDGFAAWGTTDGLGHIEGVTGGLGAGGAGLSWTAQTGTWGAAAGVAGCSALAGGLGLATVSTGSADGIFTIYLTRTAGAGGMVLRYVDADNYLYAYHDGTNTALIKRVAGVETNVVAPTAKTYAAGTPLTVRLDGTEAVLYYNHNVVGSIATAPASVATSHGLYTNDTNPTFDDFQVWARR